MADGMLIVGGYGAVGAVIAATLARSHGDQLIVAGRNAVRAATQASKLGRRVRWRVLDVAEPVNYDEALANVGLVVMCLDLPNLDFVRECFQRGIDYVDISAEYPILDAIAGLNGVAREHGATAVLSVGLVPGLSNLLARHSLRFVEPIIHFDSAILAGLGEKHGVAGSTWILNHMTDATGVRRMQFCAPYGQKPVHRFAFSDQYTLPQTLPIHEAATWLGFDSWAMTQLVGLARNPVLRRLFQSGPARRALLGMTQRFQFGSEEFVLTTRACGETGTYQAWIRGTREAEVTGLVTAEIVRRMAAERHTAGVYHIEQLFQLEDVLPSLEQRGVSFSDHFVRRRSKVATPQPIQA